MRSDTSQSTSYPRLDSRRRRCTLMRPITWPIRRFNIVVTLVRFWHEAERTLHPIVGAA
jgi:hypothetical protein